MKKRFFTGPICSMHPLLVAYNYTLHISILPLLILIVVVLLAITGILYKRYLKLTEKCRTILEENQQLHVHNEQLKQLNHSRETHFHPILHICSGSLYKMEAYCKTVHRKLKAGQYQEVCQLTSSSSFLSEELKVFHQSFDTLFLNLYPNFTTDINELLLPEEKFKSRKDVRLSPELRVCALMKMGITNSRQIATLLHYSPQTVYNYKLKIFNKSKFTKREFIQRLQCS